MRLSRPVLASVLVLAGLSAAGVAAAGLVEDPETAPVVVETADLPVGPELPPQGS